MPKIAAATRLEVKGHDLTAARRLYQQAQFQLVARSKPHHSFGQHLVDETWERAV